MCQENFTYFVTINKYNLKYIKKKNEITQFSILSYWHFLQETSYFRLMYTDLFLDPTSPKQCFMKTCLGLNEHLKTTILK